MASPAEWAAACRPRTLAAALSPVFVGIAIAHAAGKVVLWRAVAALFVALLIQIGTNLANDYADGVRGTDKDRVGPMRLVAAQKASPAAVRSAAIACFGAAAAIGAVVAFSTSLWLIALGAASILAGWLYTGGPRPYGYVGLGEAFVFVFFGPVAVLGTTYVSSGTIPGAAWLFAIPVGLLSVALLVVNNLRDITTDAAAGKKTLAVRIGAKRTRALYRVLLVVPYALVIASAGFRSFALVAFCSLVLVRKPLRALSTATSGRALIEVLAATGALQLGFGVLFALGIAL